MKITTLFTLILTMLILVSCKKNDDTEPDPVYSDMVAIEGKDYPTVVIGGQIWTIVNYAGPGGRSYGATNEKPEYGKYYTLEEMRAIALPAGWRVPTAEDYVELAQSQGVIFDSGRATGQLAIKSLVSASNWRSVPGTNKSKFNAQPGGYCYLDKGPQDGDIAEFWTAEGKTLSIQEGAVGQVHNLSFYQNSDSPGYRFNVRFVRNK